MKRFLAIPVIAWAILIASAGVVAAWYAWGSLGSETKVKESLSITGETEFNTEMYPGQSNTWTWEIKNSAPVGYTIRANLDCSLPSGVSISAFTVGGDNELPDLQDDGSAEFSISANSTILCRLTVTAANDAALGTVHVRLYFSRG